MKKIVNPVPTSWQQLLRRPTKDFKDIESNVTDIFSEIKNYGDQAVARYTQLYDGVTIDTLLVSTTEIHEAEISIPLQEAIKIAKANIEKFHSAQKTEKIVIETTPGVLCWQEKRPIQKVGLYIPGGSAPLFSTVLMLAIPAVLAGCKEIVLCTPPNKNGAIHPAILYVAKLCGINKIAKVGGIQAIAAMTFGTESILKVDKIFGPGNQYVTVAKQMATTYGVAIDMPAGPSELLVFADSTANPDFVASDLLSQAEHGSDSQVILVTTSETILDAVVKSVTSQLQALPRKEIAKQAIRNSKFIHVSSKEVALQLINQYAPEHLSVVSSDEAFFMDNIEHAGSVFIGSYTPESAGDYASGTNHTLPTNGYARQYSGVHLDSFLKNITFQKISESGIQNIGPIIEEMATAEGLQAHKNAVTVRLKSLNEEEN